MSEGGARARRRIAASCLAVAAAVAALAGGEWLARRLVPHIARQDAAGLLAALEVGSHLIVEYGARGRRFVPGARVVVHNAPLSHQDVVLEIDSRGLRDREIPQRRRQGELRVLALGDSITAVDYLPAEQGWVEVLERALAPRWSGPVEVVNAGMGNVGLGEELALLEDVGLALEPQIVLLAFYLNDGNPSWSFSSDVADRGWLRRYSVLADFVATSLQLLRLRWSGGQESPLFAWVRAQDELPWRTDRAALLELAKLAGADWGAAWSDPVWPRVEEGMGELARLAGQAGARVVVLAFPVSFQVHADYVEDTPQRRLEAAVRRQGFGFFDVLSVLREHREDELFFDQCHLVPRANTLVAEALGDFLARETLPALPSS